jgi:hypothetical protein
MSLLCGQAADELKSVQRFWELDESVFQEPRSGVFASSRD